MKVVGSFKLGDEILKGDMVKTRRSLAVFEKPLSNGYLGANLLGAITHMLVFENATYDKAVRGYRLCVLTPGGVVGHCFLGIPTEEYQVFRK